MAEGLCVEVEAYFAASINLKLAEIFVQWGGLLLDDPVVTYRGIKSLDFVTAYPALVIYSPRQTVAPLAAGGAKAADIMPELVVGILVIDPDDERVQTRLYRYAQAVTELLLEGMETQQLTWNLATDPPWEIDMEMGKLRELGNAETEDFIGGVTVAIPKCIKIETKA